MTDDSPSAGSAASPRASESGSAGQDLAALEEKIGIHFKNPDLLAQALVHSSSRRDRRQSNERLEFLGDRVLGLAVAALLYHSYPDEDEGDLGYRFTALVRSETLAEVARGLDLGRFLSLSSGEDSTGGRKNPGLLSDACEAVIGAIYLDAGFEPARAFVERHWQPILEHHQRPPKDAKTRLQEWGQSRGLPLPAYRTVRRTGPDHAPRFVVSVTLGDAGHAEGEGASKRMAEQAAAEALLASLGAS